MVDLTEYNNTFPNSPDNPIIPLDSTIREIEQKFSDENSVIFVEGIDGSGKTELLRQFCEIHQDTTFSYFLTNAFWSLEPSEFISLLCDQMEAFVNTDSKQDTVPININLANLEALQTRFSKLSNLVIKKARQDKVKCYFVIDGLDKLEGSKGKDIIDLFPLPTSANRLFLLGSGVHIPTKIAEIKHLDVVAHSFSFIETQKYLEERYLNDEQLHLLQEITEGVPGFLQSIRNQLESGAMKVEDLANVKREDLYKDEWEKIINEVNENTKEALLIITFTLVPLSLVQISQIGKIDPELLEKGIYEVRQVLQNLGQKYSLKESYLTLAKSKFLSRKNDAIEKLKNYYYENIGVKGFRKILAEYQYQQNAIEEIKSTVTFDYIISIARENTNFLAPSKILNNVIELTTKAEDFQSIRYILYSSILNSIQKELIGELEVRALLAMKEFTLSLEKAASSNMPTTKIRLFTLVVQSMEANGQTVPRSLLEELTQITRDLRVEEFDPDLVLSSAVDLFPILPDIALNMVERVNLVEKNKHPLELFTLLTSLRPTNAGVDELLENINNDEIKNVALSHSKKFKTSTSKEVIQRVEETKSTEAKIYLLWKWLKENDSDPLKHIVLGRCLDILIEDVDYQVPLRTLRQLSESVKSCIPDVRKDLITRFDNPKFDRINIPFEEKIRLELNLVEGLRALDNQSSKCLFYSSLDLVNQSQIDLDVKAFCYALIWNTSISLFGEDHPESEGLRQILDDMFLELINRTALHDETALRTIIAVSRNSLSHARTLIDCLNTNERREDAIAAVLNHISDHKFNKEIIPSILESIDDIKLTSVREKVIITFARNTSGWADSCDADFLDFFNQLENRSNDPDTKVEILAIMIHLFTKLLDFNLQKEKLLSNWNSIDPISERIVSGYEMIQLIADNYPELARDIYNRIKDLKKRTSLAHPTLFRMYYKVLILTIKLAQLLSFDQDGASVLWESLIKHIDYLPSDIQKVALYGQLAVERSYANDNQNLKNIMNGKVIPVLSSFKSSSPMWESLVTNLALALYLYDITTMKEYINRLTQKSRDIALFRVIFKLFTRSNIYDPIPDKTPIVSIDQSLANQSLELLSLMQGDRHVYNAINLISSTIASSEGKLPTSIKIDLLNKLTSIAEHKLPDKANIEHKGYYIVALADIEKAMRKVTDKSQSKRKPKHAEILQLSESITNLSDRMYVKAHIVSVLGEYFQDRSKTIIDEFKNSIPLIPSVKERIDRLQVIAEACAKQNKTSEAIELLKIGQGMATSLDGLEKEQILAALIQTLYQYDEDSASRLTENLKDSTTKHIIDTALASKDLAKTPSHVNEWSRTKSNKTVLGKAARKMQGDLIINRYSSPSKPVLFSWLINSSNLEFEESSAVIGWVLELIKRTNLYPSKYQLAFNGTSLMLDVADSIIQLGTELESFSEIPPELSSNYQALSANITDFKVGEREKAKEFIAHWLEENSTGTVEICDPYFWADDLWILKHIPNDVNVKIVSMAQSRGNPNPKDLTKLEQSNEIIQTISEQYRKCWYELSNQAPPRTLVVIHNSVFDSKEQFHDRYILCGDVGLSLGASLNGLGKKESAITFLRVEDVHHVRDYVIKPKLDISSVFDSVIFFTLP